MATDNRRSAIELLRKIKQHSSPRGDATPRLAHCFAEGLEVRLTGSVKQVYKSIMAKRTSVVEFLEAYRLYLSACCFEMMSFKFSNMTIVKTIAGRKKVHIVDYDVHYGLQWPTFLGHLATREGGPPEVRITGIDLLQPGFRPTARVEETGRRLSNCARQFCVPFKFHGITAKWETICVDDLNIDPDEVLIVNGSIHFGNLMDEGINIDSPSPRDVVLSNIRKMKPNVFILYIRNVSYNNPFFVSRFREALFHYCAMFDMLDATAPRDSDLRLLIERDLFGQSALNAITCEGLDRVERPETYKQWQVRNHWAGLTQLPLDPDVVKVVRENVKDKYHKDFLIDVDDQWLLEGWKGRILHAMSTWAADDSVKAIITGHGIAVRGELMARICLELTGDCWHLLGDTFAGLPGSATLAVQQPGTLADRLSSRLHDCLSRILLILKSIALLTGPADLEPFSPSAFLNLPPTPDLDGDGGPASADDIVLPLISSMLMEEDLDDDTSSLDRHPDHPALLQVQPPFAEILSEATTANGSTEAAADLALAALLPPSSDGPEFAGATWPYDPFRLSQQLLLRSGTGGPGVGAGLAGSFLSGGGASTSASFGGQSMVVTMDMLNRAFLKGMEEASKFLPTDSSSLLKPSGSGDHLMLPRDAAEVPN
ncbi:hypothetical protein U9M48_036635 [Paspalum notatum var. saurae]|uniref:Scarecrow-like protein 9 n=1 Tax=Paspalum notatum var. saurae TaxID=547442 RepID=A0AAQ3XAA6_PASNO